MVSGRIGSAQRVVIRKGFSSVVLIGKPVTGSGNCGGGGDEGESGTEEEEG